MELTLKESQFNLGMIAATIGSTIKMGDSVYSEESVTLGTGGVGTVTGIPLTANGTSTIYGWVDKDGVSTKVTFTGKTFTLPGGQNGDKVCVRYYNINAAAKSITVSSNIVPSIVKIVLEAQIASKESGTGIIGNVQIIIPRFQLDGSVNLSLTSSGTSTTDLKGNALSFTDTVNGCTKSGIYAKIIEIDNNANWYDDVYALAIVDDSVSLAVGGTNTLEVRAIPTNGAAFIPPYADLTFASTDATKATVGASTGVVTGVAAGSTIVSVAITSKNTVSAQADITVTA